MEAIASLAEYKQYLAARRGETLEELHAWMKRMHMEPHPCQCGEAVCRGWRLYSFEELGKEWE